MIWKNKGLLVELKSNKTFLTVTLATFASSITKKVEEYHGVMVYLYSIRHV